jgi:predicted Zn-dependent protease
MTVLDLLRKLGILGVVASALVATPLLEVPAVAGETKEAKRAREAAEGASAFERAMVFYKQGAHAEAEKEFRTAEKKTDNKVVEYVMATAENYLKLHKPDDSLKRYEKVYKKDPTNARALAGMAESYEEMQNYREAVRIWQRYVKAGLSAVQKKEGERRLAAARKLFAERYEIAENPGGGAENLASPEQELAWGLGVAQEIASSGVPELRDEVINSYVKGLCQSLVAKAKNFPTNYRVFVLDSATVNAFTSPGFIFVFRGILDGTDDEAALAGVLAHEIGHSLAHHVGKSQTRAVKDDMQVAKLKASSSKLSRMLGKLLESGNPVGQLAFSRENEAQADRLGVHIAYDAGYDPRGLVSVFQKFESMSPSSRKSWDLMSRTHPFSIDRLNAVNDYVSLLPAKTTKTTSPAYQRMKTRLEALPPAPDATGQLLDAPARTEAAPPKTAPAKSYSVNGRPFKGEIPADWTIRNSEAGIIFEGQQGTEAYLVSVQLELLEKEKLPGKSLADLATHVRDGARERPDAAVEEPTRHKTSDGREARVILSRYTHKNDKGTAFPYRRMSVLIDYPGYYVSFAYYGVDSLYEKYMDRFEMIGERFRYTGKTAAPAAARAAASGR